MPAGLSDIHAHVLAVWYEQYVADRSLEQAKWQQAVEHHRAALASWTRCEHRCRSKGFTAARIHRKLAEAYTALGDTRQAAAATAEAESFGKHLTALREVIRAVDEAEKSPAAPPPLLH